jgi:uncharacterized Zn-binding protein involved in type VI secretion
MGKLIVAEGDKVQGTDKHNVKGPATPPPPGQTYIGVGDYDYVGSMTDQLSDFVKIDGRPVASVSSKSSLNPGESTPPTGKHSGPMGKNFMPAAPAPVITLATPAITDPIGTGIPNASAGSSFVSIDGTKVLLDGDKIDTCDGLGGKGNSTVTSQGQSFVSCSG